MLEGINWILVGSVAFAAVLAWVHTVLAGRVGVRPVDTERVINLPTMGTIAAVFAGGAAFVVAGLTEVYTLIPAIAGFFGLLTLFAATDYYYRRLPNILTGYTALYTLVTVPASLAFFTGNWLAISGIALACAVVLGLLFMALSLFSSKFGMGDVKLIPSLAFWVISLALVYIPPIIQPQAPNDAGLLWLVAGMASLALLLLSFVTSTFWLIARVVFSAIRKNSEKDSGVPFGVFLAFATVVLIILIPISGAFFSPTPLVGYGVIY